MSDPIVETSSGKVEGFLRDGVFAFRGVQYGAPPVGHARWKAPRPPQPWAGVRPATEFGNWAPQPDIEMPAGSPMQFHSRTKSEDCLVLNVWTSGLKDSTPKPVIVSLHGGAFTLGAGDLEPDTLVQRGDVVVVSMNHRLGLLGHLFLGEIGGEEWADAGNAGVLDVVLALEWVRDNIANFGGDPSRVMTMGCSGGSSKTLVLMGMPGAKGLFHRANPIDAPFIKACEPEVALRIAEETLADLGVGHNELHKLYDIPWPQLLGAQNIDIAHELADGKSRNEVLRYYPVVDGRSLPAHPFDPVASPLSSDVPMMTGWSRDSQSMIMMNQPWFGSLDDAGLREVANKQFGPAGEEILSAYRRTHPGWTPSDTACAIITDRVMKARTIELAERKALGGNAPAYLYEWAYKSPGFGGVAGARHGGELPFVFKMIGKESSEGFGDLTGFEGSRPRDFEMQEIISEAWVRFAHDGDPNHSQLPKWDPYSTDERATMIFADEITAVNDPEPEIRKSFQNVPEDRWM
ncbi:MAG: putative carboxylesterase, type [Acidimicrobiia bacterium]|nr:putative carboxylesterase, type [Acidimicrobiia bacterium]